MYNTSGWQGLMQVRAGDGRAAAYPPRLDVPLALKVMDHIEAHPGEHRQWMWATRWYPGHEEEPGCGTSYCFAGHVAQATMPESWSFVWDDGRMPHREVSYFLRTDTGQRISVASYATGRLGVTAVESAYLFDATNTRENLRDMVCALVRAEQQRLWPRENVRAKSA